MSSAALLAASVTLHYYRIIQSRTLEFQEKLLPVDATSIASQLPIATNDAMARHKYADWVLADCPTNCPTGLRLADSTGNGAIGYSLSEWNLQQFVPDFDLEWSSLEI